jgi:roadblock/LC7 domain-containing protein
MSTAAEDGWGQLTCFYDPRPVLLTATGGGGWVWVVVVGGTGIFFSHSLFCGIDINKIIKPLVE